MKRIPIVLVMAVMTATMAGAAGRPNIVVILADDMGYNDAGFTGSQDIHTPNLDRLAAEGVVFKQGYVNHPFCAPSRAALLSGRYQHRFGFETNPAYDPANPIMGIDPKVKLFPKRLQKAGYVTGVIGKWHLGAAEPFHPNNRGFDYFYGFLGGGHDYFRIDLTQPVKEAYLQGLVRNNKPATFEGYLTTALSRDAIGFIETNKDKPFFLYLAYNCPHAPQQAPQEDIDRYGHIKDKRRRVYAAMVDVMDRGIGEVVGALKRNGLYENTLLFFLSDNGGPQPQKGNPWSWNGSSNHPFRSGKGSLYDGGVHVPFIACWPAKIAAGSVYRYPVMALDISRTALAVSGVKGDDAELEGVNLMPYLLGEKSGAPHEMLFWRSGNNWSVLAEDGTKHLQDVKGSGKPELYYLPEDIGETKDLMTKQPQRANELYRAWQQWNQGNVPCRIMGYKDYHKVRDRFFGEAIPRAATEAGYRPEIKGHFK